MDLVRLVAVVGVICIHLSALQTYDGSSGYDQWLAALSRFGVPYFFAASGFLLGTRPPAGTRAAAGKVVARILPIWAFWEGTYLLLEFIQKSSKGTNIFDDLGVFQVVVQGGPAFHLWFLPSLMFVSVIAIVSKRYLGADAMLRLSVLCFAALIATRYLSIVPFAGTDVVLDASVRSLEGVFFFTLGWWFASQGVALGPRHALALLSLGAVGHVVEVEALHRFLGTKVRDVEVTASLALVVTGLLMLATSVRARPMPPWIMSASRYTLGIYAAHLLLVRATVRFIHVQDQVIGFSVQLLVASATTFLAVYLMSFSKGFRRFIR